MSLTDRRLVIHTDKLVKAYLLDGLQPDELVVEESLKTRFAKYYNAGTESFTIEIPLWAPSNITYREVSDYRKWNLTQAQAAEDADILYDELIDDTRLLSERLYMYIIRVALLRNRILNLTSQIQNLMLLSDDADGFLYTFYDTFVDATKVSFAAPESDVLVNVDKQQVELALDPDSGIEHVTQETSIVNLNFIQDGRDVNFIAHTSSASKPLSSAKLSEIFNNKAIAWQREITLTPGPLVAELKVRIAPLEPIIINRIEIETKMANYTNQLSILVYYASNEAGTDWKLIPATLNPQFVGKHAVFNFPAIAARWVKFIITKTSADTGDSYSIGFQYISFFQVKYLTSGNLYSIPIAFPDGRPINKVAIEVCETCPQGTSIDYSIIPNILDTSDTGIPISPTAEEQPLHSKIISMNSLSSVTTDIYENTGTNTWTAHPSGYLYVAAANLVPLGTVLGSGNVIIETISIERNIGPTVTLGNQPAGIAGYQVNPSGYEAGSFLTYGLVSNPAGVSIDFGNYDLYVDNRIVNNLVTLTGNVHKIVTTNLDHLQAPISSNLDKYYAWNTQYVSPFDFYNNKGPNDANVFTYEDEDIKIKPLASGVQELTVDMAKTFHQDGEEYPYATTNIAASTMTATDLVAIGQYVYVDFVDSKPRWIAAAQIRAASEGANTLSLEYTVNGNDWITINPAFDGPPAATYTQTVTYATIRFAPVYVKRLRFRLLTGHLHMGTGFGEIFVYAPIWETPDTLYTTLSYLPTGNVWGQVQDLTQLNASQTLDIYDGFTDTYLCTKTPSAGIADISTILTPAIYFKIHSTNTASYDPYSYGIRLRSPILANEQSRVHFDFTGSSQSNVVSAIRFHAKLSSDLSGITPELQSYRIKLL